MNCGCRMAVSRLSDGVASIVAAVRTLPMMVPRRVVTVLQAETLLASGAPAEPGAAEVELADPYDPTVRLRVRIDPRLKVAANADRQARGWPLDSPHIERFWLPILGPTSTALLRWCARDRACAAP